MLSLFDVVVLMAHQLLENVQGWEGFMLIGGVIVFLCIFELFLAMISTSPKVRVESEWKSDTEV